MSNWAPPSAQEYPAQPSTAVDALMNRIRKLEGLVAELTKGSPLRQAGMGVSPGQVDFDGNVVIGGDMSITGTLSLPAGIIDNAALTSPAEFARTGGGASGFEVSVTATAVAEQAIPIPAGYTQALVMAVATAAARNNTSSTDFLFVGAKIGTTSPNVTWAAAEAGKYATATGSATRLVTGLSGGSLKVSAWVSSQAAPWAGTTSMANVDAIAIFLR